MTTTELAPPPAVIPGSPAYAAAGAWLLGHTPDVWAIPSLVSATASRHQVDIQVKNEADAETIAAALGITAEPVHSAGAGACGYVRKGDVDGIRVAVISWWRLDQDSEVRA